MKYIAIIGAMEEEVSALMASMEDITLMPKAGMKFTIGLLEGTRTIVVRSGIGKVNAAMCTQILADKFDIRAIINTGIAGSLNADIDIGDIVLSTDALQHDVDAVRFGYQPGEIPRMGKIAFEADKKLLDMAEQVCRQVNPDIKTFRGRILSGDQFIADAKLKEQLVQNFGGYCTEMEGAAIAQAAFLNKIPFLIIRSISDKADGSADMDSAAFTQMAVENSVRLVKSLIRRLA